MTKCTYSCDQGRTCTCGEVSPYLYKWIALDIWVFKVVTLGNAKPGECISSAAYRADYEQGRLLGKISWRVIDFFAFVIFKQREHCKRSYEWQINIYNNVNAPKVTNETIQSS